jgi:hypothetical protein
MKRKDGMSQIGGWDRTKIVLELPRVLGSLAGEDYFRCSDLKPTWITWIDVPASHISFSQFKSTRNRQVEINEDGGSVDMEVDDFARLSQTNLSGDEVSEGPEGGELDGDAIEDY